MGCKDALDDPDGVYRNSDGLLVRVEPRSLTWAELLGSDSASPRLRLGVQPKSDSSAQLWLVDRLSYYKTWMLVSDYNSDYYANLYSEIKHLLEPIQFSKFELFYSSAISADKVLLWLGTQDAFLATATTHRVE